MKFRPGQKEVAQYKGGFMAVPAVPGAGKTTILSWLAARLIADGLPRGSKVLVVTVMNSAVANFTAKIGDWLEERELPRGTGHEVRTLHSLALQIIRQRPDAVRLRDDFFIVDGGYRERMIDDIVNQWIEKNSSRWQDVLKIGGGHPRHQQALEHWRGRTTDLAKAMLTHIKGSGFSPQEAAELVQHEGFFAWSVEIYREYQRQLTRMGQLDFDDLLLMACRLVEEDKELCRRLAATWPYIFEDEAQDSNPLQQRLLLALSGVHGNLVRVGDSNQAIMGTFTDSDPNLFREFCRHKEVSLVPLLQSSRSSRDIIELANALVSWSRKHHPVAACRRAMEDNYIEPVADDDPHPNPRPQGYTLGVRSYPSLNEEVTAVSNHAAGFVRRNPEKTVAILAPTNWLVGKFAAALEEMEAPVYEITTYPAHRRKTIDDLLAILAFLARPGDNKMLVPAVERLLPELADDEALKGYLETVPVEKLLFSPGVPPATLAEFELWPQVTSTLETLSEWLQASHLPPDQLVLELANGLDLQQQELAVAQKIAVDVKYQMTANPSWRLPRVVEELIRMTSSLLGSANLFYDRSGYQAQPGVVNLVTAHKAKGLEWDTVYVVSLTSTQYPGKMGDRIRSEYGWLPDELVNPVAVAKAEMGGLNQKEAITAAKEELLCERLRLLYVAVTRARENLLLTWHSRGDYGRQYPAVALKPMEETVEVRAGGDSQ